MNYKNVYNNIINNAKLRGLNKSKLNEYHECHHIIPKCLGGLDNEENLVLLTAREHYICHVLLCKIYPNNKSLLYAWNMMKVNKSKKRYFSSIDYKSLKENFSRIKSERFSGKNNPNYGTHTTLGYKFTEEQRRHVSNGLLGNKNSLGCKMSPEHRKIMSEVNKRPKSPEHCKNISKKLLGVPKSESHKRNVSIALTGVGLGIPKTENHKRGLFISRVAPLIRFVKNNNLNYINLDIWNKARESLRGSKAMNLFPKYDTYINKLNINSIEELLNIINKKYNLELTWKY